MTLTLSTATHPMHAEHQFLTHNPCTNPGVCPICDGGLSLCLICGALEGALLDYCPGVQLTEAQHDWNYRGYGVRMRSLVRAAERRRMTR